jgi:hypothetical protein
MLLQHDPVRVGMFPKLRNLLLFLLANKGASCTGMVKYLLLLRLLLFALLKSLSDKAFQGTILI